MPHPAFGVAFPAHGPLDRLVAGAREAEELGYRNVWVTDDRLQKDVFVTLAAMAVATAEVQLGPGVTNPFSRHPALIATGIATLDELSGGRAVLGLGAGGTNHRALGVTREAPVQALAEAVEVIRGLMAGREVTLHGRVVQAEAASLDFTPVRSSIPIFLGARGPRMLELAGAIADGVIVGNVASPAGWKLALARITAGAVGAGRNPDSIGLTAWVYCSVAEDPEPALDAIRPMVATSMATSRKVLAELGVELPEAYVREMESLGWRLDRDSVERAGRAIPPEMLRWFGLAGTADDCVHSLRNLLGQFPQISQVVIVPAGPDAALVTRRFMLDVVPRALPAPVAG